jgi:hypothetical protein
MSLRDSAILIKERIPSRLARLTADAVIRAGPPNLMAGVASREGQYDQVSSTFHCARAHDFQKCVLSDSHLSVLFRILFLGLSGLLT